MSSSLTNAHREQKICDACVLTVCAGEQVVMFKRANHLIVSDISSLQIINNIIKEYNDGTKTDSMDRPKVICGY